MQVSVSVAGRFHAFDLARQLNQRGFLRSLITSYPKFKAGEWGIERSKVRSILSHELLARACRKLDRRDFQPDLNRRYDRIVADKLAPGDDLFVAWSGMALHSLRRARQLGAKTVLERNSSHIVRQAELLRQESELTGFQCELPHPKTIAQELEEYEQADSICVPSTFAYRSFLEQGVPQHKLRAVPFGVDTRQFAPIPKRDSVFRIIHCGSLTIRKGIHYLLQAFHELKLKNSELWLIGAVSQEARPYLSRYGGPNVVLRGLFPQPELYKEYSQGSVFCLASVEEGFGMVISQAMACGLPAICTPNGAGEDLVRDSMDGFVVPARDVEALKERFSFLHSRPEQARAMGQAARKRILEGFTWDHYGNQIVNQYSRILGIGGGAAVAQFGCASVARS